jgi:hypothetical protein
MSDESELSVELDVDGTMTVEGPDFTRVYNPTKGVKGEVTTDIADDGSVNVTSTAGSVSSISADGTKMTITKPDGTKATATEDSTGVTVEVDGVVYTYKFNASSLTKEGVESAGDDTAGDDTVGDDTD